MCLVKIEKMPKLQTACTTVVSEGMVVVSDNEEVRQARKSMVELLLGNHPLDCPVCDAGGECELQDMILGVPGILTAGLLIAWTLIHRSNAGSVTLGALPGSPQTIGKLLFHDFLLPFEVTSVLVLIAIMGAVVLAQRAETPNLPPGKEI